MKIIFHLDLDSYFVSAERTINKNLKGKPVAISYSGERATVLSVSYEAKKLGLSAPMPLYTAKRIVPDIVVVKPSFGLYTMLSTRFFEFLFNNYTNKIQVASIDECYLDVSDLVSDFREAKVLALKIQQDLMKNFDLPCSIGISNNKFVAKMASPINKPFGVTTILSHMFLDFCGDFPVRKFFGIGHATEKKLNDLDIFKIKDLAKADLETLKIKLGVVAKALIWEANGNGSDEVETEYNELKGIGNELTFQHGDKFDRKDILEVLDSLVEMVAQRMKNRNLHGRTISVYFRASSTKGYGKNSQQVTLPRPIGTYNEVKKEAFALFDKIWTEDSIKYIGVRVTNLVDRFESTFQVSIFDKEKKKSKAEQILEQANSLLGKKILMLGTELLSKRNKEQNQSRYIESDRIIKRFDVKGEE